MTKYFIICVLFVIQGCDTFHGINNFSEKFTPMPEISCVLNVIKSINDVSDVEYVIQKVSKPLTITGIQKADRLHIFTYKYKGIKNSFYLSENYIGEIGYSHTYGGLHWMPPKAEVDTIYPFFIELEKVLFKSCGLKNIKINRYCSENCPSV